MSDEYDEYEAEDEPKPKRNWRRELEEQAAAGRAAQEQLAQAQRELAFHKAAIPMDAPGISYFVKGYDGDLTADAIRKAAQDAGFLKAPEPDPGLQSEIRQHSDFTAAAGTATPGDERTRQADAIQAAKKAADAAPPHMAAQVYADTLAAHGFARVATPPS